MQLLVGGRYTAKLVGSGPEREAAMALRSQVFRGGGADADGFDLRCDHMVVTDDLGTVVACLRILFLPSGAAIADSYAAQFYDLTRLARFAGPMAELGRVCVHPDHSDAEVLRVIWSALTRYVDARGVQMLFGCTSFPGAKVSGREAALRHLAAKHLAPARYMPQLGAAATVALRDVGAGTASALSAMPPVLRTYLSMGAWVSDHAVLDHDLDTLHVFTGLEIARVPEARKRLLRALG